MAAVSSFMSGLYLHVQFCSRALPILSLLLFLFCAQPAVLIPILLLHYFIDLQILTPPFLTPYFLHFVVWMFVFSSFYLIGDFNIDFLCTYSPFYNKILSVVSSFNLLQIVSEPTRVSKNTATLIDLVFVSSPLQVESCSTIPPLANSDHNGIQLHVLLKCPKRKEKITPRKVWKYSLTDYDTMAVLLSDVDWDQVLSGDVDECWSKWKTTFLRIMGICIPHLTFTPRDRVPWLTNSLIKNIRKRKALYQTYIS